MLQCIMRLIFICLLVVVLSGFPAFAQDDDGIIKDSIYFTMDDGVMTVEEMEEEAEYVFAGCSNHLYQNRFFDCRCIAGAFLKEREKRGPMALQQTILTDLFRTGGGTAHCGNQPAIAGKMYQDCMDYARLFRRLETNNEDYCRCTGNQVARHFGDYPYLRTAYIERLRVHALLTCDKQFPSVHSLR